MIPGEFVFCAFVELQYLFIGSEGVVEDRGCLVGLVVVYISLFEQPC